MRPNINIIDCFEIDKSFSKNNFTDTIFSTIRSLFEKNLLESSITNELNERYNDAKYNLEVIISNLNSVEARSNLTNKTARELHKLYTNEWFEARGVVEHYRKMLENRSVSRSTFIDGVSDIITRDGCIIELIYKKINNHDTLYIDIFLTGDVTAERIQNIKNHIDNFIDEELLGFTTPYPVTTYNIDIRDR